MFTLQDNKLIQKESWKDKEATYVREVDGDDLIAVRFVLLYIIIGFEH